MGVPENERSFLQNFGQHLRKERGIVTEDAQDSSHKAVTHGNLTSTVGLEAGDRGGRGLTYQPFFLQSGAAGADESGHFRILLRVFLDRETWPREGCPQSRAG